ncbi:PREDICTED: U11/U12 small nuclear ribonucleoprotein 48 kDa protein-like [Nicrophorus vespilloides]|uniref:U11/U12 small nuclear ribonucleoprotein 48 kDa protein-like n=1 Tax=Nicrophorus vespilloides TaxID=110193 RepID=A0ABM1N973_NICVS|nr:PREDICTED: U11/U12 small nuclear ribonucleoprotein 48 kDa protein-like [Nicrophorus vespilloides]XP_017783373.1 PREDICTED: U11/U12 small nuclear ribonucleoprotein 48 kDa protein-like [Nicrophorus vespilloides]
MMDINIEMREKQLENFDQFISNSKSNLDDILSTLDWTADKIKAENKRTICPQNPGHLIHLKGYREHVDDCSLKVNGYDLKENFLAEPGERGDSNVYFDKAEKIKILSEAHYTVPNFRTGWNGMDEDPKTADRLMTTYSPDERLALYERARIAAKAPKEVPEFNLTGAVNEANNKELTYEEVLEQERNAKRRRIKYKSVHTSKKNHTEVLRDVIKNQMEAYEDWIKEQQEGSQKSTSRSSVHSGHSRDSKRRRSRERSSRRSSHEHQSKYRKNRN